MLRHRADQSPNNATFPFIATIHDVDREISVVNSIEFETTTFSLMVSITALTGQTAVAARMGSFAAFMTSEPCDVWR